LVNAFQIKLSIVVNEQLVSCLYSDRVIPSVGTGYCLSVVNKMNRIFIVKSGMFSEINNHIFCWSADNAGIVPTGFSLFFAGMRFASIWIVDLNSPAV